MVSTNTLILLGGTALVGGFLFFTKEGQALTDKLMDEIGSIGSGGNGGNGEWDSEEMGFDDPFAYEADDPDAFLPGTARYQEIVRKNRGRTAASALFRKQ